MDTLSKTQRSLCMSRIRSKNTQPELAVRKTLTKLGWRYRLHVSKLPGKPDVVIAKKKLLIFINGCFWHQHKGCKRKFIPKTNINYWQKKLQRNVERQKENIKALKKLRWHVIIVWECQVNNEKYINGKFKRYLNEE